MFLQLSCQIVPISVSWNTTWNFLCTRSELLCSVRAQRKRPPREQPARTLACATMSSICARISRLRHLAWIRYMQLAIPDLYFEEKTPPWNLKSEYNFNEDVKLCENTTGQKVSQLPGPMQMGRLDSFLIHWTISANYMRLPCPACSVRPERNLIPKKT